MVLVQWVLLVFQKMVMVEMDNHFQGLNIQNASLHHIFQI